MESIKDSIKEEQEFLRAIRDNSAIITKICYYYASCKEEFEDLRQDVLINIWESLSSFKGESSLSTWIYRLTLNTCISAYRKKRRKPQTINVLPEIVEEDISLEKLHSEMHHLISQLSASEKAIILMWLDDMKYQEISEVIGIPRNTIASRLRRIKEKIVNLANS